MNEDSAFRSSERIKNITTKVAQLTVAEVISRHQGVEAMLRLHSLNNINGFRGAARPKKEKLLRAVTHKIAPHCNYELDLIYPQEKATKQFEPLAILTFSNPQQKYTSSVSTEEVTPISKSPQVEQNLILPFMMPTSRLTMM